jgi:hypothetical protein
MKREQKMNVRVIVAGIIGLLLFVFPARSQELSTFLKQKPISVSGGLSATMNGYASSSFNQNIKPFGYSLNGNINVNIYGFVIPINLFLSDQVKGYNVPFTLVGASPTWKRWTFHAGIRNLNWGNYSLAGAPITGGGVEYAGNKFRFGFVYGRLAKAVAEDTLNPSSNSPSFERWGWAFKTGFNSGANSIDLVVFRATDDLSSIPYVPVKSDIKPRDNLVTTLSWRKRLQKHINWDGEFSTSLMTRDTRSGIVSFEKSNPTLDKFSWIFTSRLSTQYYFAGLTGLSFSWPRFNARLQYKRVDNDYSSLGALYVQNDVEEFSGNIGLTFFKNKVRVNATGGYQHDNLNFTKASTSNRIIGSGSFSINPVKWYGIDVSYSNFLTDQQQAARRLVDTARSSLVNENLSVSQRFTFSNQANVKNIMLMLNRSSITDRNSTASRNNSGNTFSSSLSFSYSHIKSRLGVSTSVNFNQTDFKLAQATYAGLNAGINKSFLNGKISSSLSLGYGLNYSNGVKRSGNLNGSINASYTLAKRTNMAFSLFVMNNEAVSLASPGSGETRATLTVSQSF